MTFAPTAEQNAALEIFKSGLSFAIQAGAGTGKTSTLKLLAESTTRRGQYIAFNKAIVDEAGQKMPGNLTCSTAHSLAYRAVGKDFSDRLRSSQRMRSIDLAHRLKLDAVTVVAFDDQPRTLLPSFLAGVVMNGIVRFCQSADEAPSAKHVPYITGLDAQEAGKPSSYTANRQVAKALEPALVRAWADLSRYEGVLPYRHDHYLKAWQLSDPKIGADFILFDEAQDANPVMVAIVAAQTHAQLVWVGDSQQQIYTFTGAVNALDNVPSDQQTFLTQSFRFGPAVADVANQILSQIPAAQLRLVGTESISSVVAPVADPDVVLTRTNAAAVRSVLEAQRDGKSVHLVGGGKDIVSFAKAARDLQQSIRVDHPELACFENWVEVQAYVAEDEQGGDLKLLVGLIDEFSVQTILDALEIMVREEQADLVISTAHKSKGREWNAVQLAGDFPEKPGEEELRLLYVACTRAKRELDITAVQFLNDNIVVPHVDVPVVSGHEKAPVSDPKPAPAPDNVPAKRSTPGWVGEVGGRLTLSLTVARVNPTPTRYGGFLTILRDQDGNSFKWFADEILDEGSVVSGSWGVKAHEEWNGRKETMLNRPQGIEVGA